MKKCFLFISLAVITACSSQGKSELSRDTDTINPDALKLIELLDDKEIAEAFKEKYSNKYCEYMKKARPQDGVQACAIIKEEVAQTMDREWANHTDISKAMEPIITASFSDEELKTLVTFYSSAAGQKSLEVLPDISYRLSLVLRNKGNSVESVVRKRITERLREEKLAPE